MMYVKLGLILSTFALGSEGLLKCWHCENQKSNWECLQHGRLEACKPNQQECQNEIRSVSGNKYFTITKRCKQDVGCNTNKNQNHLRPKSYSCEKNGVESVCWCCCNSDNCNGPRVYCLQDNPKCEGRPSAPLDGFVACNRLGTDIGTTCLYRCRSGHKLIGSQVTTCVRTGFGAIWSSSPPICEGLTCQEMPFPPEHGSVSCTDRTNLKSKCTFTCDENYVLVGFAVTTCSHFGTWDNPAPLCIRPACRNRRIADRNLIRDCNNGNLLGSVCRFSCREGYELRGRLEISCGSPVRQGRGRWQSRLPRCRELPEEICPPQDDSTIKYVSCTRGRNLGSECTYECEQGEYMTTNDGARTIPEGEMTLECLEGNEWSDRPPFCRTVVCPFLRPVFRNGERQCSGRNTLGSECSYTCNSGYRMFGSQTITCIQGSTITAGIWSSGEPACEVDESAPGWCGAYNEYENGDIACTHRSNGTHWRSGTKCRLTCLAEGFQAHVDLRTITCDARLGWTGTFCCERCLSSSRLDVIVLMDSSYANPDLWEVSKSFNPDFALYVTENLKLTLNFVIIPYSTTVDEENIVRISDISFSNYQSIEEETNPIDYDGNGDSNTGKALKYVVDNVLDDLAPASVPLVVILTNEAPADRELAVNVSQELRNQFIHIRIIPFTDFYTAEAGTNAAIFATLTGDEEGAVVEDDSVETFYTTATAGIDSLETYCDRLDTTCRA